MSGSKGHDALTLHGQAEIAGAGLEALMLAAERLAASALPGAHGQRRAGMGEAFWQYRHAMPGDSMQGVDWRRSARTDTLYLREREAQAPRQAVLWVDGGPGMAWASRAGIPLKSDHARVIALALGLALLRGGERVAVLGGQARTGRHQASVLAQGLVQPEALDPADLRAGQMILLVSDWLAEGLGELHTFLDHAAMIGVRGALVQILDPAEAGFPYAGAVEFRDPSGRIVHRTRNAQGLRAAYLARLEERQTQLSRMAHGAGWQFAHFTSDAPSAAALSWLAGAMTAPG